MPENNPRRSSRREHGIARIDISPLEVELTEPFSISAGGPAVARNVLVKMTLNNGTSGYGEAAPFEAITGESQESTIDALRSVSSEMVGLDASEWRTLAARLRAAIPTASAARCAVEQAAIDAFARHLGISLSAFFGGPSTDLVTDITIPAGDIPHSIESARRAQDAGFKVVKVKIAAADWETDVARLAAISDVAPELAITVDANAGYSRAEARAFTRNAIAAKCKADPSRAANRCRRHSRSS
jgi:L-alanine-DL-glutamate epimerase-like enolase superfamily enzyme